MKLVDFQIKDADLVAMEVVELAEYLTVAGLDREGVSIRFTIPVFTFDKLRAQYKEKKADFEAEIVRQSLDEPCPTDHMGNELPPEIH
tara:strand:+ start:145 stop:408 length:264 start_codon:yes stop_codon:yes gene_type:complete